MKALILSGGSGTRLRPFSHSMPKQLMPIANRPVLEHVLTRVVELGVTEIGIVVGNRGREIADALGDSSRFGARIAYIPQERPLGLAHCVSIARDFLRDDDFVMFLGDNMLSHGVSAIAEDFRVRRPATQLVVHKVADPRQFGVAEIEADGTVTRLVEKPAAPRSDLAVVGVYFFTPAIHEAVAAITPSARGELEITHAIQWLIDRGDAVYATEYSGHWSDTGRLEDVLDCNREVLDGLARRIAGEVDGESRLLGQVVVEAGARVYRSHIEGPAIIGARSTVSDSRIGPHTSIGRDCVIQGAGLGDSIALDGARVTGVTGVHGSVIGRDATVTCVAGAQQRLIVGDHSTVVVAA
ncbi:MULTISPECIES: glucose-1-phosphate thymidylyltransferase [unclassified Streptomyces]|uniref:glucose-1-phosphate thymidylyltransferase n=1 Tax=unclassified Streptomyces TaxID=2593676 RepID=UPI0037B23FD1